MQNIPLLLKISVNFSGNMALSLSDFTSHVKEWNRFVYNFIGSRKKNLMKSLLNIQRALDQSNCSRLIQLEVDIRDQLENLLDHEELLRRQKARCDQLQFGYRNTKFFHSRMLQRQKFNRITPLHTDNGEWCFDQNILQTKAVMPQTQLRWSDPNFECHISHQSDSL